MRSLWACRCHDDWRVEEGKAHEGSILKKHNQHFLSCIITMNVLPVTSYAKDKKDVEDTAVGGIERDYIYRDARNENTNVIHADYAEMYGMEDEEYQEKINFCIQRMMLDDVFLKLEKK